MANDLIVKGKDTPVTALQKLLTANAKQIEMATRSIRPERLIRLACTAVNLTPSLQNCNMLSICNSVMLSAQLGLEINNGLGHGWLIPYKGVCTFQPGYRGLIDLAYRAESIKTIQPIVVYDGDEFDLKEGDAPHLYHVPVAPSKRAKEGDGYNWIGAYSRARIPDGSTDLLWMWREEIEELRRKSSKAGDNSPWNTWFWEMVKKTPTKRHMKFLRLSPEAEAGVGIDDQAEAFAAKEREGKPRRDEVAQDMVLEATFVDQALDAEDKLSGSREDQQHAADEKIERLSASAARKGKVISEDQIAELRGMMLKAGVTDDESDRWLIWCNAKSLRELDQKGYTLFMAEIEKKAQPA